MEAGNLNKYEIVIYMIKSEGTEREKESKYVHCPHTCCKETAAEPCAETVVLSQGVAPRQAQTFKGICP